MRLGLSGRCISVPRQATTSSFGDRRVSRGSATVPHLNECFIISKGYNYAVDAPAQLLDSDGSQRSSQLSQRRVTAICTAHLLELQLYNIYVAERKYAYVVNSASQHDHAFITACSGSRILAEQPIDSDRIERSVHTYSRSQTYGKCQHGSSRASAARFPVRVSAAQPAKVHALLARCSDVENASTAH